MATNNKVFPILSLPDCAMNIVLSYLPFSQISELRIVSKGFDSICQQRLNFGYFWVTRLSQKLKKEIQSQMPKRDSLRDSHRLYGHLKIVDKIEAQLWCFFDLKMMIRKNQCCFFAGQVCSEKTFPIKTYMIIKGIHNHQFCF